MPATLDLTSICTTIGSVLGMPAAYALE